MERHVLTLFTDKIREVEAALPVVGFDTVSECMIGLRLAKAYAGERGRVLTASEVFELRLQEHYAGRCAWERDVITSTTEFYGRTRAGTLVLAVMQGNGPLLDTSPESIAYWDHDAAIGGDIRWHLKADPFQRLLDGHFGEVEIIDWNRYARTCSRRIDDGTSAEALLRDEWFVARLGGERSAEACLKRHQIVLGYDPDGVSRVSTAETSVYAYLEPRMDKGGIQPHVDLFDSGLSALASFVNVEPIQHRWYHGERDGLTEVCSVFTRERSNSIFLSTGSATGMGRYVGSCPSTTRLDRALYDGSGSYGGIAERLARRAITNDLGYPLHGPLSFEAPDSRKGRVPR